VAGLSLFLGAGIKILYDVLLYASFRHVVPPEEQAAGPAGSTNSA